MRELRWRFAKWSTSSDREFHDSVFSALQHDPFSPSYPGNLTIRRFADLAARHLGDVRSVLDLGCGPGEITCELARRHPSVAFTGFDHSPVAIERAREHARRLGLENVGFDVANLEAFTPQAPVDLIAMFDAFHHVLDPSGFVARLRPFASRFFLIEPAGSWTGQWDRRRDLDWLPATVMQIAERLEYELDIAAASSPSGPGAAPHSADPTEHRYTMTDFERFFDGYSLDVRGTIAGLEQYGARPLERSTLRDRLGAITYDMVVRIEDALVEEGLDLNAKHWAIFATSLRGASTSRPSTAPRLLPPKAAARGLLPPYAASYDSYVGPRDSRDRAKSSKSPFMSGTWAGGTGAAPRHNRFSPAITGRMAMGGRWYSMALERLSPRTSRLDRARLSLCVSRRHQPLDSAYLQSISCMKA